MSTSYNLNGTIASFIKNDPSLVEYNKVSSLQSWFTHSLFIPKLWFKRLKDKNGTHFFFSTRPKKGYHLHSAFYNNGEPVSRGIVACLQSGLGNANYVKAIANYNGVTNYSTDVSMPRVHFRDIIQKVFNGPKSGGGWHLPSIYEVTLLSKLHALHYGSNFCDWSKVFTCHDGLFVAPNSDNKTGKLRIFDDKGKRISVCPDLTVGFGKDIEPISWIHNKTEYISGIYRDTDDPSNLSTVNFDDLFFVKNTGDQGKLEFTESLNSSGSYTDTELYLSLNNYIRRDGQKNLGKIKLKDGSYVYPLFVDDPPVSETLMASQMLASDIGPATKGFKSKSLLSYGDVHVGCASLGTYHSISLSAENGSWFYYAFKYV